MDLTVKATCPPGTQVTGGGTDNPALGNMQATRPTGLGANLPGRGWSVTLRGVSSPTATKAYAICIG